MKNMTLEELEDFSRLHLFLLKMIEKKMENHEETSFKFTFKMPSSHLITIECKKDIKDYVHKKIDSLYQKLLLDSSESKDTDYIELGVYEELLLEFFGEV